MHGQMQEASIVLEWSWTGQELVWHAGSFPRKLDVVNHELWIMLVLFWGPMVASCGSHAVWDRVWLHLQNEQFGFSFRLMD